MINYWIQKLTYGRQNYFPNALFSAILKIFFDLYSHRKQNRAAFLKISCMNACGLSSHAIYPVLIFTTYTTNNILQSQSQSQSCKLKTVALHSFSQIYIKET